MKIALISPNDKGSYRNANFLNENLGLGYLWAYLEERGHTITLCDARFHNYTPNQAKALLENEGFDVLGFSIWTGEGAEWCQDFLNIFLPMDNHNHKKIHVILGGYFPTLQPERSFKMLPQTTAIVMGEGEIVFDELLNTLMSQQDFRNIKGIAYYDTQQNKVITTERAKILEDLDTLPWPKRYLIDKMGEYDEVYMEGSRGCVFCCTFCAIRPFIGIGSGSPWRHRSARSVVEEIKHLKKQNPTLKTFRFIDSDFIGPSEHARALEFADLVKQEVPGIKFHIEGRAVSISKSKNLLQKLKEAGLFRVYLGVESGSQKILNKMNKQTTVQENIDALAVLNEVGVDCTYGFIMFTPWTTEEDIDENVKFLKNVGNIQMNKFFTELLLIPNTAAYKMARRDFPIEIKDDDRTYYTYPSLSPEVGRVRKIAKIFEKKQTDFMNRLWFIHRGIRNAHRRNLPETKQYESASSNLFLKIFDFCWKQAKETSIIEKNIVQHCMEHFHGEINQFLDHLKQKDLLKISSYTDEFQHNVS